MSCFHQNQTCLIKLLESTQLKMAAAANLTIRRCYRYLATLWCRSWALSNTFSLSFEICFFQPLNRGQTVFGFRATASFQMSLRPLHICTLVQTPGSALGARRTAVNQLARPLWALHQGGNHLFMTPKIKRPKTAFLTDSASLEPRLPTSSAPTLKSHPQPSASFPRQLQCLSAKGGSAGCRFLQTAEHSCGKWRWISSMTRSGTLADRTQDDFG